MAFTTTQIKALEAPLDPKNVKPPAPGKYGDYVEGWHVIAEANRIFGFDGWSRETVEMIETCRQETTIGRNADAGWAVGYRAKVRVTVGDVTREGSAGGSGEARKLYDAVESAVKEAETDAMKRALSTFGNPFGLALYDKSRANVHAPPQDLPEGPISDATRDWIQSRIEARQIPVGDLCAAFVVTSLKALKYEQLDAVKDWIRENGKDTA